MPHTNCFQQHTESILVSGIAEQSYKRRNPGITFRLYAPVLLLILIIVSRPYGTEAQSGSCSIPVNFEDRSLVPIGVGAGEKGVAIGDFNGDGKPDLATALAGTSPGLVSVVLGDGNGGFGSPTKVEIPTGTSTLIITGDFNIDGKTDLAVCSNDGRSSLLIGNGSGGFSATVLFSVGINPVAIVTDDFNADGKPDLATADAGSGAMTVLLGDGKGSFSGTIYSDEEKGGDGITSADFNGDGKVDLIIANSDSGSISLFLNNGMGSFKAESEIFKVGGYPGSITSGDFNLDGRPDVAISDYYSGNVIVLLRKDTRVFSTPVAYKAGSGLEKIINNDFSNDGFPDLAVADSSGGAIIMLGDRL
ncbi:MAG: VCBS repeat-containing protein, partial [Chitinophagaceae bacterium]